MRIARGEIFYRSMTKLSNGKWIELVTDYSKSEVRRLTEEMGIKSYEVEMLRKGEETGDYAGDFVLDVDKYRYDEDLAQYLLV